MTTLIELRDMLKRLEELEKEEAECFDIINHPKTDSKLAIETQNKLSLLKFQINILAYMKI